MTTEKKEDILKDQRTRFVLFKISLDAALFPFWPPAVSRGLQVWGLLLLPATSRHSGWFSGRVRMFEHLYLQWRTVKVQWLHLRAVSSQVQLTSFAFRKGLIAVLISLIRRGSRIRDQWLKATEQSNEEAASVLVTALELLVMVCSPSCQTHTDEMTRFIQSDASTRTQPHLPFYSLSLTGRATPRGSITWSVCLFFKTGFIVV